MNNAARKRRIEVASGNKFTQLPPRSVNLPLNTTPNLQRSTNVRQNSVTINTSLNSSEAAKTSTKYTLSEIIQVVDQRLTTLEIKNATSPTMEEIVNELAELRTNVLNLEEKLFSTNKFIAESLHILFEKTGCQYSDSLILFGEHAGIEVSNKDMKI